MPTYPLATLAPTIDSTGIHAPSFTDIYQSLIATFKSIYGQDIYVDSDSQDGQWINALAHVIDDSNQAAVATFNSFSPTYAQGTGLSSLVKINGIARNTSTNSTAVGNVVGVAGTVILNGVVKDTSGNLWNLPASVTIPIGGSISVTVTAQKTGAISVGIGAINQINNPQFGWQSFTNTSASVPGAPIETDADLRTRQSKSTAGAASSIVEAIGASIGAVAGVTEYIVYENPSAVTDANGIPAYNIAAVVAGGTVTDIVNAIYLKKTPGTPTYGNTSGTVTDKFGLVTTINYFVLATTQIYYAITIKALQGYAGTTTTEIVNALVNFTNALIIGEDVYASQAQAAASLINLGLGQTFYITSFTLGTAPNPVGTGNITIPFNQVAGCASGNIVVTVT